MRYLKALIKTIKQMDEDYRCFLYFIILLVISLSMFMACYFIELDVLVIGSAILSSAGLYFLFKPIWKDIKCDIKKFFRKVKSNIE